MCQALYSPRENLDIGMFNNIMKFEIYCNLNIEGFKKQLNCFKIAESLWECDTDWNKHA